MVWSSLINRLLPQSCLLCGDHSGARSLCPPCHAELPWHGGEQCPVCALPTLNGSHCGACIKNPPAFDRTTAAWHYGWPMDRLIPAYKYRSQLELTHALAQGLLQATEGADQPDMLLPMPLHPTRLRERGFNQSQELARQLGRWRQLPLADQVVARIKLTPPQASLPRDERQRAIRGAFAVQGKVAGQHIALVDDVMTTGASLNELAHALKKAGARRVDCWVLARTL
ncbi:ComF family protein [Chitinimonas sp. JJ19]|uniref:ComF family protein n=1 Tax=Chitinimonas sp. JJ19 TaxID=3109352 RepID=UPI001A4A681E|nr:ComF family protein [Chitinimonas sp.]